MHERASSVRSRLRKATADHHERVEMRLAILGGPITRSEYLGVLKGMYGLYRPIEAALARIDWNGTGIDFASRRRVPLIRQDLLDLGLPPSAIIELPLCPQIPRIVTAPDAVGVLYVLEGSTLGGQFILRKVGNELGIGADFGGHFFSSHGADIGAMWRGYLDSLERFGGSTEAVGEIEQAAIRTFDCFDSWFRDLASNTIAMTSGT